jgi:hypothetical protein
LVTRESPSRGHRTIRGGQIHRARNEVKGDCSHARRSVANTREQHRQWLLHLRIEVAGILSLNLRKHGAKLRLDTGTEALNDRIEIATCGYRLIRRGDRIQLTAEVFKDASMCKNDAVVSVQFGLRSCVRNGRAY